MPSDGPPQRPSAPAGGPPRPTIVRPTQPPATVDPALRRGWSPTEPQQQRGSGAKPRQQTGSVLWAALFTLAIIGGVVFIRVAPNPDPATQGTGPGATAPQPAPEAPPVPVPTPQPSLVQAYGSGTLSRAAADAMRVGRASAIAVACARQEQAWLVNARDNWSDLASQRYRPFDDGAGPAASLRSYLAAVFRAGEAQAAQDLSARDKDGLCADIATSPDYLAAVRAAGPGGAGRTPR